MISACYLNTIEASESQIRVLSQRRSRGLVGTNIYRPNPTMLAVRMMSSLLTKAKTF